jgi:hypothetical protein
MSAVSVCRMKVSEPVLTKSHMEPSLWSEVILTPATLFCPTYQCLSRSLTASMFLSVTSDDTLLKLLRWWCSHQSLLIV